MIGPTTPFQIEGPALISFSGGRTSAYMLYRILRAHGGQLPRDIAVTFANTGKEREETMRFIYECGLRWNVPIVWLERLPGGGFKEVGPNSASRSGEPFEALIAEKRYLPNAVTRFCTQELKIRVMRDFALSLGWQRWSNVVGLRYDEGARVLKALARNDDGKERFTAAMPLARARITKRQHILPFWLGRNTDPLNLIHPLPQGFDLGLRDYEGNCDCCFLKSAGKLDRIMRDHPGIEAWWVGQEQSVSATAKPSGAQFVTEYSYADLKEYVARSPLLLDDDDQDHDTECGFTCAPEMVRVV